ncbi:hypothetical protein ACJIZ3_021871 [Penstemon smallii]|uniref:Uncharacterized protein n=1 Tax=Penstemon smallii TaxID=265156 RepID=A0ABD3SMP1_9LAMI
MDAQCQLCAEQFEGMMAEISRNARVVDCTIHHCHQKVGSRLEVCFVTFEYGIDSTLGIDERLV